MLNNIGLPGLLLIAIVVVLLFGRGKISQLMGDVAKGIRAFRKGMAEDEEDTKRVEQAAETARDVTPETERTETKA